MKAKAKGRTVEDLVRTDRASFAERQVSRGATRPEAERAARERSELVRALADRLGDAAFLAEARSAGLNMDGVIRRLVRKHQFGPKVEMIAKGYIDSLATARSNPISSGREDRLKAAVILSGEEAFLDAIRAGLTVDQAIDHLERLRASSKGLENHDS